MDIINKQLIYYFYIDSEEFYDIYKIHLKCINSYGDIFSKYTFLLSLDDINNQYLIEKWKKYIIDYIGYSDKIEFIFIQNDNIYREGIHYYNYIFKKLNEFDGLVLWGHGKRDFFYNKDNIIDWVVFSHYICSSNIQEIENKLIYDNYCFSGPNLSCYNGKINNLMYQGSFYWMNPKKIYNLFKQYIDLYINNCDYFLKFIEDNNLLNNGIIYNIQQDIRGISENSILFDKSICHHFQNNYIIVGAITSVSNFNDEDLSYTYNDLYINKCSETLINYYNDKVKNEYPIYKDKILNILK